MELMDAMAIAPAVPEIARSFGTTPVAVSSGISSYLITVAIFIPAEPKVVEMPVLLEIGDVLSIIARDFEIDIPEFETFDAWFGKR